MKVHTMPRLLLLLFAVSFLTLVFVVKCFFSLEQLFIQPSEESQKRLQIIQAQNTQEIVNLNKRISLLESELEVERYKYNKCQRNVDSLMKQLNKLNEYEKYVDDKIKESEIVDGFPMKTEYDIPPFNRFTLSRIYLVDPGLGKRVVEKPIAFKKKDLFEIINFGINYLNNDRTNDSKLYTIDHFLEGIYRTAPSLGSQYELYFRHFTSDGKQHPSVDKLTIVRPFAPPKLIRNLVQDTGKEWINLILPLSGRLVKFHRFMARFIKSCIKMSSRVFLTIVYFGDEGFKEVKESLTKISQDYSFSNMKLVNVHEPFSRGRGLQVGVLNWKGGDVLLFFCDVDIVFGLEYLERCRLNTERGRRIYYPIVFSLYNPNVVYSLHDEMIPQENDQLTISKDTGFWRDFGYGMTCQYRSDFLQIKGFDEHTSGWGGEDVFLYQKYIKSKYLVIRVTDPGIFHLWHEKVCDRNLTADNYRSCIRSKALNEASHAQLGLLAFKDEIHHHKQQKKT